MAKLKNLTLEVMDALGLNNNGEIIADMEANNILEDIALTLFGYRTTHNLSQTQMAKLIGVSQPMITKLESGDYNPSIKQLITICQKLNLDLNVKITEETRPTSQGYFNSLARTHNQNYGYINRGECIA